MEDDILSNLEAQIVDGDPSAERPGVTETSGMVEASPVPARGGSAMPDALSCLPPAVVLRISTVAARYGIRHDSDPMWALVEAVQDGMACAQASGAAAQAAGDSAREVAQGVARIPKEILKGAMQATKSIQGDIAAVLETGGDAILAAIKEAAAAGSDKVKEGSKDLIEKLDKAVEVKKKEGVSEFALAAAGAASAAVRSEARVKLRYSALFMALIFIVYAGLGWAANCEYLSLSGQITPAPLVLNAQGKANCGLITGKSGKERVCEIR